MVAEGAGDIDGVVGAALQVRGHIREYHTAQGVAGGVHQTFDVVLDDGLLGVVHQILQIFRFLQPGKVVLGEDVQAQLYGLQT